MNEIGQKECQDAPKITLKDSSGPWELTPLVTPRYSLLKSGPSAAHGHKGWQQEKARWGSSQAAALASLAPESR